MTPRGWGWVAFVGFGAATVVAVLATTPWQPTETGGMALAPQTPDVDADFTAEELARADSYASVARPPAYASLVAGLVVTVGLGATPLGARIVTAVAAPLGGGRLWRVTLGTVALSLIGVAVTLPFAARSHVVRRTAGLSSQDWSGWAGDQAKAAGLTVALLLVSMTALFTMIRRLPRSWPMVAAAAAGGLVLALSFLFPVLVEPLFARFTPMPAGPLRTALEEMAAREDVPVGDVLVADASRRTTALNAYVSGLGSTRRLVVYDTLLERAPEAEVRSVVAHEIGHAASRDGLAQAAVGALAAGSGVGAIALVLTSRRLLARAGAPHAADPRALPLVLAAVAVLTTATGPVQMLVSRRVETRADVAALQLTRDPATFARMQRRLAVQNLSDPDPPALLYALFASHPTAPQRIALARAWARAAGLPPPPPQAAGAPTADG